MTPEEKREYHRQYREKNKHALYLKRKEYREKNKEKIKARKAAYHNKIKNTAKYKEKIRKYKEKNREKILQKKREWHWSNRERILQQKREYSKKHMAKRVAYAKAYNEKKPEVKLASTKKSLTKFGKPFNLKWDEYAWALLAWGKTVRKIHGAKCGVCGSNEGLNTHHILFKTYFPELSLNENNGIPLCKVHHKEVHRLNPIYKTRAAAA